MESNHSTQDSCLKWTFSLKMHPQRHFPPHGPYACSGCESLSSLRWPSFENKEQGYFCDWSSIVVLHSSYIRGIFQCCQFHEGQDSGTGGRQSSFLEQKKLSHSKAAQSSHHTSSASHLAFNLSRCLLLSLHSSSPHYTAQKVLPLPLLFRCLKWYLEVAVRRTE